MAKPEWGVKRLCQSCGARFYDMQRDPIVCPSCGATFDPELLQKARRRPKAVPAVPKPAPVPVEAEAEEEVETTDDEDVEVEAEAEDDDEEADAVIEDASELGEDEDLPDVEDEEENR